MIRKINFATIVEVMLTISKRNPMDPNPPKGASCANKCVGPAIKNFEIPKAEDKIDEE